MNSYGKLQSLAPEPYVFIRTMAAPGPEPYEFIRTMAAPGPEPYEFTWKMAVPGPEPYEFTRKITSITGHMPTSVAAGESE